MGDTWNKCVECGQFVPFDDFITGAAINTLITPDSEFSAERFEVLCRKHSVPVDPSDAYRDAAQPVRPAHG